MIHRRFALTLLAGMVSLGGWASTCMADAGSNMTNVLSTTGEGNPNPAYGTRVKNILIFQTAGWSGLPAAQDCYLQGTPGCSNNPTWPAASNPYPGGRVGYLSKSNGSLLNQMAEIKTMSPSTAIAVLIMPDEEAAASGYGACFQSNWTSATNCSAAGTWATPKSMFATVAWAAWMKGIQVAPLISINVYDHLKGAVNFPDADDPNRAAVAVARLQSYVDWYMSTVNATTLKSADGRVVILTEGLPIYTNLSNDLTQQNAVISYMKSRTDILWIDNFTMMSAAQAGGAANIYRSAATEDTSGGVQDSLKSSWGSKYLWHFLDRFGANTANTTAIPEDIRLKWLNISPTDPQNYPIVISQWNEYAESLTFEPDELNGKAEYNYLQWRLSQQP